MAEHLQPCPFCGDEPWFEGDASAWKDDSRYVEMSLGCCARITDTIGWRLARDMTHEARTERLKAKLSEAWNRRAPAEPAAAQAEARKPDLGAAVDRFLGWRLPDDFFPDCGISFKPLGYPNGWPIGTNLLTAAQAREMLAYVLGITAEDRNRD